MKEENKRRETQHLDYFLGDMKKKERKEFFTLYIDIRMRVTYKHMSRHLILFKVEVCR
jgi:hypothetical protein